MEEVLEEQSTLDFHFTPREKEILSLLLLGLNDQRIAEQLGISLYTEKNHIKNILRKSRVRNRIQVIIKHLTQETKQLK